MAGNQSLAELTSAEKQASEILLKARQGRGERLKQAKVEAEEEINAYRKQLEDAFQLNNTDLLGDSSGALDAETDEAIKKMGQDFTANKQEVINMMTKQVCSVTLRVPDARKK